jgi:uncharacterized protein
MAGSRAVDAREPGQIREEAALSDTAHAPRISLAGADDRRARPEARFEGGCTVRMLALRSKQDAVSAEWRSPGPAKGEVVSDEAANEELARRAAELYVAGDVDAYADLFAEDAVFYASSNWPEPGPWKGREAIRSYGHEWHSEWRELALEVKTTRAKGDRVAALCTWRMRGPRSGAEGDLEFAIVFTIRDGRIAEGRFYDEPAEALAAVGV